jgi:hypothetical protein
MHIRSRASGCTTVEANGYWLSPTDEMIADKLLIVSSWTDSATMAMQYVSFVALVEKVKTDMAQQSIAFEADNQLWLF